LFYDNIVHEFGEITAKLRAIVPFKVIQGHRFTNGNFMYDFLLVIMVALWNRADHYIFALWFLLSFFLLFSWPNLSGRRLDVCHISTRCGLSANLGCRSETCCMRLAENAGRKKCQKSSSAHHRTTLSGYIFATKALIDNRKKFIKQQYLLHMSS